MYLKISSAEQKMYEWHVSQVTIPTEAGEITVLPGHASLTSVVRPGLMRIRPQTMPEDTADYVVRDGEMVVSLSKWLLIVDKESILITTSAATKNPQETEEVMLQMKQKMEEELKRIRQDGSIEDIEHIVVNLEKITADLRLVKLKQL